MDNANYSSTPHDPPNADDPVLLRGGADLPIRWQLHVVLLSTAFVSWAALIFGVALSMRNMFGGPPPDESGTVFIGLSALAGLVGIGYFVMSRSRRSEATRSGIQVLVLVLLIVANALPLAQSAFAILSIAGDGF